MHRMRHKTFDEMVANMDDQMAAEAVALRAWLLYRVILDERIEVRVKGEIYQYQSEPPLLVPEYTSKETPPNIILIEKKGSNGHPDDFLGYTKTFVGDALDVYEQVPASGSEVPLRFGFTTEEYKALQTLVSETLKNPGPDLPEGTDLERRRPAYVPARLSLRGGAQVVLFLNGQRIAAGSAVTPFFWFSIIRSLQTALGGNAVPTLTQDELSRVTADVAWIEDRIMVEVNLRSRDFLHPDRAHHLVVNERLSSVIQIGRAAPVTIQEIVKELDELKSTRLVWSPMRRLGYSIDGVVPVRTFDSKYSLQNDLRLRLCAAADFVVRLQREDGYIHPYVNPSGLARQADWSRMPSSA